MITPRPEYQGPPQRMRCDRYGLNFMARPMQAYCPHCGWANDEEYGHRPAAKALEAPRQAIDSRPRTKLRR